MCGGSPDAHIPELQQQRGHLAWRGHGAPSLWHTHLHLWVIVCIRQGSGRPHYTKYTGYDLSEKIRPHPSLGRLENDLSEKIRPHPSLGRLENDSSKS